MQGFWWVVISISAVLFVFVTGVILPKLFFKESIGMHFSRDRGLKSYREKNGRSVVFRPAEHSAKYISQYIISDRNGKKSIICSIKDDIRFIDYSLSLFNSFNKPFSIVNITETIEKTGYTRIRELPPETSYVSLTVNSADGCAVAPTAKKPVQKIKKRPLFQKIALFAAACIPLSVLEVFLIDISLANIFGDVFSTAYISSAPAILTALLLGIPLAVIATVFVFVLTSIMSKKKEGTHGL